MSVGSTHCLDLFFLGYWGGGVGFEPVKFGFISKPLSFCDIDMQRLLKIPGYHDKFIKFFSYEKMSGNPG